MSPYACPGAFTMLAYIEHRYGIWHVEGGLAVLAEKMAEVALKKGTKIHYDTPVKKVLVRDGMAYAIQKMDNSIEEYDDIIINADFSHAMNTLFDPEDIKKWAPEKLTEKKYSCSTFMIYLGLDTMYPDEPHHHIVFSENYMKNVDAITHEKPAMDDFSFYIRNASITDTTLAPSGKSEVYILVPMSNTRAGIDWDREKTNFRNKVIEDIQKKTNMKDLSKHIISETILTPDDWEKRGIYAGATFNLAHTLDQMLYFRPHNEFECVKNCYIV